ncbi:ubiquitin carboxyl-terminal hydrolase 43 [Cuculus canorus]|uniref:ubiquitin carboxyl-terminal hydrolase 43 n=1 Tax=Cuculus canorus TaxID=55661 RepID=UPI0023AAC7D6|nr:ubiquitin carboxyl-terminal hydrolase 43 [Cuculus canorus]
MGRGGGVGGSPSGRGGLGAGGGASGPRSLGGSPVGRGGDLGTGPAGRGDRGAGGRSAGRGGGCTGGTPEGPGAGGSPGGRGGVGAGGRSAGRGGVGGDPSGRGALGGGRSGRRSLRALGSLAGRLLRSWSRLPVPRGRRRSGPEEDDDGGFRGFGGGGQRRAVPGGGAGPERPPGAQGLRNHGNTCFMNAVVQCLSHTAPLAERLALGRFRGARAEVTRRLAALVRALWTRRYSPRLSAEFKNIVSKHSAQFRGNAQHDALEFLLWLLDRLHEDLGATSPTQQPHVPEEPGEDGSGDASSSPPADQHPGGQSFVQSHFQAQYRSSLTCPHCLKQSNTFDPFLCISLPIPLCQTRALNVTLVLQRERQRFVRVGLAVPLLGTVAELREMVAREGRIPPEQVILAEVSSQGFLRSLGDTEELGTVGERAPLYAFQPPLARRTACPRSLPASPGAHLEVPRLPPTAARSSECLRGASGRILLLLCNVTTTGPQLARFGPPLVLREERSISWEQLQQSILSQLRALLRGEVRAQGAGALFRICLAGSSAPCPYLSPQDPRPLCHPAVDRALRLSGAGGPPHVNLTVEWDLSTKERLFGDLREEVVQDAESVRLQQQAHQQHSCTLDECFQLYTKEEQLAPDDAWRCPHCKVPQRGTVKLSLWTLPDILIIHLKRFGQVAARGHKLSTLVRFPLRGLDMAPHMAQRGCAPRHPPNSPRNALYDLYAVCYHHGGMHGGHYTASCRNALDGRWYRFDDSRVVRVRETELRARSAYILFYQRRGTPPGPPGTGSPASPSGHWLTRLDTSAPDTPDTLETSDSPPGTPDAPEKGGFEARPVVRSVQGRSLSARLAPTSAPPRVGPPRWSFSIKSRTGVPREPVPSLELGRRPRCTRRSLLPLGSSRESSPPLAPSAPPQPGKGQEEPPRAPRCPLRVPTLRRAASTVVERPPHLPPKSQSSPERGGDRGVPPAWLSPGSLATVSSQDLANLPPRPKGSLRRSASLGRAGGGHPLPTLGPPGATLQQRRQPVGSLRCAAVPESSF